MSGRVFGWKEKFDQGKQAEEEFLQSYKGGILSPSGIRDFDFLREDGKRVELKADQYTVEKTRNFFFERWSVFEQQKPGSVWQSVNKCDIFIYAYPKSKVYFEFTDIPYLLLFLENFIVLNKPKEHFIQNKGYRGMGYCIPRDIIIKEEGLCQEFHMNDSTAG